MWRRFAGNGDAVTTTSETAPGRTPRLAGGGLVAWWHRIHRGPRRVRWPLKAGVLGLTVALVLYPKVWLMPVWLERLGNMNSVLEPEHPALAELESAVRGAVGPNASTKAVHAAVERTVRARIPYAFDWDTWGVVDYLPTVGEVFAKGREDCDGLAVVAASLLRRMGEKAWLVTDLKHVWVVTPDGEIMSPGQGAKTLVGEETGTRISLTTDFAANLGRGLAFGVAVFPMGRELIILAVLCVVTLQPRSSVSRRMVGCLLLGGALVLLRLAGTSATALAAEPALAWGGLSAAAAGWLVLAIRGGGSRSPATPRR